MNCNNQISVYSMNLSNEVYFGYLLVLMQDWLLMCAMDEAFNFYKTNNVKVLSEYISCIAQLFPRAHLLMLTQTILLLALLIGQCYYECTINL